MKIKRYLILSIIFLFLGTASSYSQTYNKIIPDQDYYAFINNDITRDSVKVVQHIFRKIIPLYPDNFYFKDSADYLLKNNSNKTIFIFKHHVWQSSVISNNLDTIFKRTDIDFFGEQLKSMKKRNTWKKSFVNSVFIDKVEYDENDKNVFGRRAKYGVWGYSLPLFSRDRRYAIIIKLNSVKEAYYVYRLNKENDWELIKEFNTVAID
jgi:hypothetical protein